MDDPVLLPNAVAGQAERETTRHFRRSSYARAGDKGYFGQIRTLELRNSARSSYGDPSWSKIDGNPDRRDRPGFESPFSEPTDGSLIQLGVSSALRH
jgi:hypothetical protein